MKQLSNHTLHSLRITLFLCCMLPLLRLIIGGFGGLLGADPVDTLTRSTGTWALNFLLLSLAVTPVRKWTGWQWLARLRRMISLYAFFYACLHFLIYLVFDQSFDWPGLLADIGKRPFILAGVLSFLLLIPLAVTSTDGMIRRLGGRRWQMLHRLAYATAILGVLHYFWLVKRDITWPAVYAVLLAFLLCVRMLRPRRRQSVPGRDLPRPSATGTAYRSQK